MNIKKSNSFGFRSICMATRLGFTAIAVFGILGINSSAFALSVKDFKIPAKYEVDPVIRIPLKRAVYSSKFTCGLWEHGKTFAQVNYGIGGAPPLGRKHLAPSELPQIQVYYHDFQPGSYSTALNILNPTSNGLRINVQFSSESLSSPTIVLTKYLQSFETVRVGCSDIERLLPADLKGALVEGFFHISRPVNDISVQAVYTYTTIAAFQ